ncbi:MAG: 30S ribosomal protein S6 [Deltaproteobacteria bacterium]|jgi:small subunit ribosomal protein S6|nr:30S ribosomal protein S6 [Deltaproteobacteria bacterium]
MHPRRYETLILLSPNLTPAELDNFKAKVDGILEAGNAKVVQMEDWGRKMLAYPVHKEHYGIYILYDYQGLPAVEAELKRNLKIDENVFKSLTMVLDRQFTDQRFEEEKERLLAKSQKKEAQAAELAAQRESQDAQELSTVTQFPEKPSDELPADHLAPLELSTPVSEPPDAPPVAAPSDTPVAAAEPPEAPSEPEAPAGELSAKESSSEDSPAPPEETEAKSEGETL